MFDAGFRYCLEGGPVLCTIFGFSFIAWIFIFKKISTFRNSGIKCKMEHEKRLKMVKDGRAAEAFKTCKNICRLTDCSLSAILHNVSLLKDYTHDEFDRAISVNMIEEKSKLKRFIDTIGLIASLCPLLGLLGTVIGMASTFYVITTYGIGEPGLMSKGISQALITTQVGLFLAVPIVFFHEYIDNKKQTTKGSMELYVRKLKAIMCGNDSTGRRNRNQIRYSRQ